VISDEAIRAELLRLALARAGASFCPSEAARALASDWRPLMPRIRALAAGMPELRATRRGAEVPADGPGGPIRLALRR
jgi:hypothetical protein